MFSDLFNGWSLLGLAMLYRSYDGNAKFELLYNPYKRVHKVRLVLYAHPSVYFDSIEFKHTRSFTLQLLHFSLFKFDL